ncbi:MAG: hypothetical protein ACRC1K_13055, partial [Planctomycetia bacterium]
MNPFIAHVEKVVLALCIGLSAYFVYGALGLKPYQRKPEELQTATTQARSYVMTTKVPEEKLETPDLAAISKKIADPIDGEKFTLPRRFLRPFNFGESFRNEPAILKPTAPLVQSNRGLLGLFAVDEKGERKTRKVKAKDAVFLAGSGPQRNSNLLAARGMGAGPNASGMGMPGKGMSGRSVGSSSYAAAMMGGGRGSSRPGMSGPGMSGMGMSGMGMSGMGMPGMGMSGMEGSSTDVAGMYQQQMMMQQQMMGGEMGYGMGSELAGMDPAMAAMYAQQMGMGM